MRVEQVKLKSADYMIPVTLTFVNDRIEFQFGFSRALMADVKVMEGAKWHGYEDPPRKIWSVADSLRNRFQLEVMKNRNPYAWYDRAIDTYVPTRSLREHQQKMYNAVMTYRHHIIAGEMGVGKTLVAIEVMEAKAKEWLLADDEIWFVGPKSVCRAVPLELIKWKSTVKPRMMTYDALVSTVKTWVPGRKAPRIIILDESSKIKTITAQRTQAATHICNSMKTEYNRECIILLMSGTPAPKSPVDWFSQTEAACPGFIKEGHPNKMRASLALTEQREGAGGMYPHHIAWLDDEKKCKHCGQYVTDDKHSVHTPKQTHNEIIQALTGFKAGQVDGTSETVSVKVQSSSTYHKFEPSINEVARLYKRMRGLVTVVFKRDCGDLPEKEYREILVQPTVDMLRAARLIKNTEPRVITALAMMRELSDGFQYKEVGIGEFATCGTCAGSGAVLAGDDSVSPDTPTSELVANALVSVACPRCQGQKTVEVMERQAIEIGSPKDEKLIELLDDMEELGRIVIWAGFEGSINRIVKLVLKEGWTVLKIDGKGWVGTMPDGSKVDANELLISMDSSHPRKAELAEKYQKLCVVANPEAGGMSITLTAAMMAVYYSNSFNGEARTQSEDRIHRLGMIVNRGCIIVDIFCLKTDVLVRENLKAKRRLELLTLGDLEI